MLLISLILSLFTLLYILFKIKYNQKKIHEKEFLLKLEVNDLTKKLETTLGEYSELNQRYYNSLNKANLRDEKIKSLNKTIDSLSSDMEKVKIQNSLNLKESIANARKDALKRSRSVLRGQASEHLAPYVIKDTNPKDYRFMGNPVDYICFDGLSDVLDGVSNDIKLVRFIDIKTGKSKLNKSQRKIRDAINNKNVSFETINLDEVLNDDTIKKGAQTSSSEKS
jgi:predicted Holliday junction resolvase-like endonuclease